MPITKEVVMAINELSKEVIEGSPEHFEWLNREEPEQMGIYFPALDSGENKKRYKAWIEKEMGPRWRFNLRRDSTGAFIYPLAPWQKWMEDNDPELQEVWTRLHRKRCERINYIPQLATPQVPF
jgi:hypothetical protein